VTPRVGDENHGGGDDDTNFQLMSPGGVTLMNQTYVTGASDADWTTLQSVTLPAAPVMGVDCGEYSVITSTTDNDDNAWRLRMRGETAATVPFQPELGADGVAGTGDESWVGLQFISYQHLSGCPNGQTFFWFSDDGNTDMYMINFDMDNAGAVTYTTPGGVVITGTRSGATVWNNGAVPRPTFAGMTGAGLDFNPPGDIMGDAIANPEPGLWSATICIPTDNQYSFEVPGKTVFLSAPQLPQLQIAKDDGVTLVNSPGSATYTITITNTGQGGALPIAGAELVDTLPAGMTFGSCAVNAPLVGTCSHVGGGVVEFQLQAQPGIGAFLPGVAAAPNNTGSVTVTATVDVGLANGTALTNRATIDNGDIFGNDYAPIEATDIDTVTDIPISPPTSSPVATSGISFIDPFITKSVSPPFTQPGEPVTWTIIVSNRGNAAFNNVVVDDSMPPEVEILSANASSGAVVVNGQSIQFTQASLNAGASVTITVQARVRDTVAQPFIITNVACISSVAPNTPCADASVISAIRLPSTGESSLSVWRLPAVVTLICLILLSMRWMWKAGTGR
jgi:uncharacterized repeat protein (TIGR01451 family)